MNISFNGFGEEVATFISENKVKGAPVKVTANGAVAACQAGENFCGIALAERNGMNSVQLTGYAEVPFTGTAVTVGYATLTADGAGGVKADADGREYLVIYADTNKIGIIL